MKKITYIFSLAIALILVNSCEVTNLEVEDSPNALRADQGDIDLFMNSIQVSLSTFFDGTGTTRGATDFGMQVTRMTQMRGPLYDNAYGATAFDATWRRGYAVILADAKAARIIAEEVGLPHRIALTQIMEAYVIITLVDMFGDIPYAEALQGFDNLNPSVDSGSDVYATAITLLDDAITNLGIDAIQETTPIEAIDLYYGGDTSKWVDFANTLKLKIYLNMRNNTAFRAVLDSGNYISDRSGDFQFRWSTELAAPDSRHPSFVNNYVNGAGEYMSNSFMNLLLNGQPNTDPRLRYYFYRQSTGGTTDQNELACINFPKPAHYGPDDVFCQIGNGYWGRDHGDNGGIPPDDLLRTIWGFYPAGGRFDASQGSRGRETLGAKGAGISPIMLSSYVDFMRAEAALEMGTGEDARALLESGMRESIAKVMNFGDEINYVLDDEGFAPDATEVNDYVDDVLAAYDAASAPDQLNIIITQYYIALWGNGIEIYNAYRRTGYPANLQPTWQASPGPFIRTFLYSANFVNLNSSVSQKSDNTVKVFWDPGKTLN